MLIKYQVSEEISAEYTISQKDNVEVQLLEHKAQIIGQK